jgi:hypothetical protein
MVPSSVMFRKVLANRLSDVWVVGPQGLALHFDGLAWRNVSVSTTMVLGDLCGTAPDDVWASSLGSGTLWHWSGVSWASTTDAGVPITGIWNSSPNLVTAAIDIDDVNNPQGAIYQYDGTVWTKQYSVPDGRGLSRPFGFTAQDIWAAGRQGALVHLAGGAWTESEIPKSKFIYFSGIWGSAPDALWAVGNAGACRHIDGTTWSLQAGCEATADYNGLTGSGKEEVWATDVNGVIRRLDRRVDPTTFQQVPSGVTTALNAIAASGPGEVWAVGAAGAVLRYQP